MIQKTGTKLFVSVTCKNDIYLIWTLDKKIKLRVFPMGQWVKNLPAIQERSLDWEYPLEEGKASNLPWKIPWTEEPGRLKAKGLQRVEHD